MLKGTDPRIRTTASGRRIIELERLDWAKVDPVGRQRDSPGIRDWIQFERYHWEVYDVEQNRGSSVWVVAVTTSGSIGRIEVAVR
jgi:hypothetical protein